MRLIHLLAGRADPRTSNGVNGVVHQLALHQHRLGVSVEVWGLTSSTTVDPREYSLRLFPRSRTRTLLEPITSALSGLTRNDWVHLHSVFVPEFHWIARLLIRRGVRFGISPNGGYARPALMRSPKKLLAYMTLERRLLRRASLIHAVGELERDELRVVRGLRSKVVLIENGHSSHPDVGECHPATLALPRPVFSYCGRLARAQKGVDVLAKAFSQYKASGGSGSLVVVGSGDFRAQFERLLATHRDSLHLTGSLYGKAKISTLQASDAFVHFSRWEGLPLSCLEAAALGLPLIVTRQTGLGTAVASNTAGIVVSMPTPEAGASALIEAERRFHSGELAAMGERARSMVEHDFSWAKVAERFVQEVQRRI